MRTISISFNGSVWSAGASSQSGRPIISDIADGTGQLMLRFLTTSQRFFSPIPHSAGKLTALHAIRDLIYWAIWDRSYALARSDSALVASAMKMLSPVDGLPFEFASSLAIAIHRVLRDMRDDPTLAQDLGDCGSWQAQGWFSPDESMRHTGLVSVIRAVLSRREHPNPRYTRVTGPMLSALISEAQGNSEIISVIQAYLAVVPARNQDVPSNRRLNYEPVRHTVCGSGDCPGCEARQEFESLVAEQRWLCRGCGRGFPRRLLAMRHCMGNEPSHVCMSGSANRVRSRNPTLFAERCERGFCANTPTQCQKLHKYRVYFNARNAIRIDRNMPDPDQIDRQRVTQPAVARSHPQGRPWPSRNATCGVCYAETSPNDNGDVRVIDMTYVACDQCYGELRNHGTAVRSVHWCPLINVDE